MSPTGSSAFVLWALRRGRLQRWPSVVAPLRPVRHAVVQVTPRPRPLLSVAPVSRAAWGVLPSLLCAVHLRPRRASSGTGRGDDPRVPISGAAGGSRELVPSAGRAV